MDKIKDDLTKLGYCHIKGIFPLEKIDSLRKSTIEILSHFNISDENGNPTKAISQIGSSVFRKALVELLSQEELHDICKNTNNLNNILRNVLNCKSIRNHPRKMLRYAYPTLLNSEDLIKPHQDYFYVKGSVNTITVWAPLDDYEAQNGTLSFIDSSHKKGLFPVTGGVTGEMRCDIADCVDEKYEWPKFNVERGDALIFTSLTVHKAMPNLTNRFRLSFDTRYSDTQSIVNRDELLPPYYPEVPSWEELAKGWQKTELLDEKYDEKLLHDSAVTAQQLFEDDNFIFDKKII